MSRCLDENDILEAYNYIFMILNKLKGRIMYIDTNVILSENINLKKYISL